MNITFLGTGTSHGVPMIDCMRNNYTQCSKGVCKEALTDKKHNRTRCSILVEYNDKQVLVDVSSDFRQQALREQIQKIDAVLITHIHADHIMGIPDIRSYSYKPEMPIPVYGSEESIAGIKKIFAYIFDPDTYVGGGIPRLSCEEVSSTFTLFNKKVIPIPVEHSTLEGCFGYRIGNVAYIPDVKKISDAQKALLKNLDCLIIDCLRETREHSTHIILPESIEIARELRPAKCYFTHMCHNIHYKQDSVHLDSWMAFAWDGLQLNIN